MSSPASSVPAHPEEGLRFEVLLNDLSARFAQVRADQVDGEIDDAQRRVCECLDLDASLLWQWSDLPSGHLVLTHFHRLVGGPPLPAAEAWMTFPWLHERLFAGRMYVHSSLDELPPEAARDLASLRHFGVKSDVGIPLLVGGGPPVGALTFKTMRSERRWDETILRRLQLVAQIFANALARKRADARDRLHIQELALLSRVATVGELTTALAHELNQPLGAILRNAEAAELLLQQETPDLEELRAIVADIKRDDARAGNVIDRLRALLQHRALDLQPVHLRRLVDEVVSLLRADPMRRRIRIETEIPPDLGCVRGDHVHVQQVLLNLVMNGMDAIGDAADGQSRIVVHARPVANQMIDVAVSDTGPGIPLERMQRIFEPFFTTKASGIGLGLALSRTIIEAHAGRLWASNNAGRGATFHFTLARAAEGVSA